MHCNANIGREICFIELLKNNSEIKVPLILSQSKVGELNYMLTKYEDGHRLSVILSNIKESYRVTHINKKSINSKRTANIIRSRGYQ